MKKSENQSKKYSCSPGLCLFNAFRKVARTVTVIVSMCVIQMNSPLVFADSARALPTLEFKKGKTYQLFSAAFKQGREGDLMEAGAVLAPLGAEYGAVVLGRFTVFDTVVKGIKLNGKPQVYALVEWPDLEAYLRYIEDERAKSALKLRNSASSYFNDGNFFTVDNNQFITLDNSKFYEIFTARSISKNKENMKKTKASDSVVDINTGIVLRRINLSLSSRKAISETGNAATNNHYDLLNGQFIEWADLDDVRGAQGSREALFSEFVSMIGRFGFPPVK